MSSNTNKNNVVNYNTIKSLVLSNIEVNDNINIKRFLHNRKQTKFSKKHIEKLNTLLNLS